MTGISLSISFEDKAAMAELQRLTRRMENRTGFFKNVGEHLMNRLEDRFAGEKAPDGSRWQAHAPATIRQRLKKDGNAPVTILRRSGNLAGSFNYEPADTQVKIGSPVIYAGIHHFGGKAGRGHQVTIPARPILGLEPDDPDQIMEIATDWLES